MIDTIASLIPRYISVLLYFNIIISLFTSRMMILDIANKSFLNMIFLHLSMTN